MNYQRVKLQAFVKEKLKEKQLYLRTLSGEKRHVTERLIIDNATKEFYARGKATSQSVVSDAKAEESVPEAESNESGSGSTVQDAGSSEQDSEDSQEESNGSSDKLGSNSEELKQGKLIEYEYENGYKQLINKK
jgi:hypothetical protein